MTSTEDLVRDAIAATAAQVTADRIMPLDLGAMAGPSRESRRAAAWPARLGAAAAAGARRWQRLLVPLAAAASVAALATVALVISQHVRSPGKTQAKLHLSPLKQPARPARPDNAVPPPYYAALTATNPRWRYHPLDVTVRATATGKVLATVRPPRPFTTFSWISGAADDRTFVLAANRLLLPGGGYHGQHTWPQAPVRFYLLRFSPRGGKTALTELPISAVTSELRIADIALSPDGAYLAVALGGRKISVFSVATGQARTWSMSPAQARDNYLGGLSWVADDQTVAFWAASLGSWPHGVFLLNTAITSGSLIASSKPVRFSPHATVQCEFGGVISPSGDVITCPVVKKQKPVPAGLGQQIIPKGFANFSVRTGRVVHLVTSAAARGQGPFVFWVSTSGDALVASLNFPRPPVIVVGAKSVADIPWPASIAIGQSPFAFPAW